MMPVINVVARWHARKLPFFLDVRLMYDRFSAGKHIDVFLYVGGGFL